jgi:hypothetical protein
MSMKGTLALLAAVLLSVGCVRVGAICPPAPPTEHSGPETIVINGTQYQEADLEPLRGLPFIRVIEKLGLEGCEATFWVDEPPGELRGMEFFLGDGVMVTLFLDYKEPMFKAPTDRGKWDCGAVFLAKVGGVTLRSKGNELDVGNVPWQWLPPRKRK